MGYIYECLIRDLRLEDALNLVPVEYAQAYEWFQEMQGETIRCLPMGTHTPEGFDFPLARQAGIFKPNYGNLKSRGRTRDGKLARKYTLSIHSEGQRHYDDRDVIYRPDGTWILDYKGQRATEGTALFQGYNDGLANCMEDGVPVGVMVKSGNGYKVLGLAYVEKYNQLMNMFTLHGPVNAATEMEGAFTLFEPVAEYPAGKAGEPASWSGKDERKVARYERVVREGQNRFREEVLRAYDGACALTGVDVPEVLQAAHIDSYRGRYTQVVTNGILLRSDIHLLYDAQLLAILPESHTIQVSDRLLGTAYERFAKEVAGAGRPQIRLPENPMFAPNDELLDAHYREFLVANSMCA